MKSLFSGAPRLVAKLARPSVVQNSFNFSVRSFSAAKPPSSNDNVPDEFYDEAVEKDAEIRDLTTSVLTRRRGSQKMHLAKDALKWEDLLSVVNPKVEYRDATPEEQARIKQIAPQFERLREVNMPEMLKKTEAELARGQIPTHPAARAAYNAMPTSHQYSDSIDETVLKMPYIPPEFLNYNISWRKTKAEPDENLLNFLKPTDEGFRGPTAQDEQACPGKRQRHGKKATLHCHKIDLDAVHYLDVMTLSKYVSTDSEILGRRDTGLCAKCQRKVARTIKRARHFGVMPHIGEYHIRDGRPQGRNLRYHDVVPNEIRFVSKTILMR